MITHKFGLNEAEIRLVSSLVLAPLKNLGARVWIFGSRARGDQTSFSDVDILFDGNISRADLSMIKEAIEESRFPYKIDLVNITDIAESYRDQILRERREIKSIDTDG